MTETPQHYNASSDERKAYNWIHCIASVCFDLEIGQVVKWTYGHRLTKRQMNMLYDFFVFF